MASEDIEALLAQRETAAHMNRSAKGAVLSSFKRHVLYSHVGYYALHTLRIIALAPDPTLWRLFGAVIFQWPGPSPEDAVTAQSAQKSEQAFIEKKLAALPSEEQQRILFHIRQQVAKANVLAVYPEQLTAFCEYSGGEEEDCKRAISRHLRTDEGVSTIYLFPFLLAAEWVVEDHQRAIGQEDFRQELDVLTVVVAKTMVHETRNLVASCLHGKPSLVSSSFPLPVPETPQPESSPETMGGEAREYLESTRYGSYLTASFVVDPGEDSHLKLEDTRLRLTGTLPGSSSLRRLSPKTVGWVVGLVEDGRFLDINPFFASLSSLPIRETLWTPDDILDQVTGAPVRIPVSRPSSDRRESDQEPKGILVSSLTPDQYRRVCAGNFRGVLRGPKSG
ncbi:hypothetical protein FB45DRAFT_917705 [Roridomyces roridus]|uniref:Uncharacterized protein n=1 Tax=Roridomyces roridus TaxID=1738132 RepID=A0AAD7BUU5_9AGAR|nr:hypothetical protein FB45DRAFT_917705 [Roridomyces roridus]